MTHLPRKRKQLTEKSSSVARPVHQYLDYLQHDVVDNLGMGKPSDLVQGTLDLLILKTLLPEAMHGWAIAKRIQQISGEVLQVQQGSLYPGAAPARTAGLDQGQVGGKRNRPPGEVLFAHRRRPQAA